MAFGAVGEVLQAGQYSTDLLPLQLDVALTDQFRLTSALPGTIILERVPQAGEYTGVAFLATDTLVDSDPLARTRSRIEATTDLGPFLRSRDGFTVVDGSEERLGGLPASRSRLEYEPACPDCFFESLFVKTGIRSVWGALPSTTQELWTIDAPGGPIIVSVEAPRNDYDEFRAHVDAHVFAGLEFGGSTSWSLPRPGGLAGPHAIGRGEFSVVDTSRPTDEITNDGRAAVPASDERELLLSVAYPSPDGGFGAPPEDGPFPLVLVGPGVGDWATTLPAERLLASHGYVVVTIRFPESSFPGSDPDDVPSQPDDVVFVLEEVLAGALGDALTTTVADAPIGFIGQSGGATTAFGLHDTACCHEDRFDAFVAHAGTPYDFESTRVAADAAILHVASSGDRTVPLADIRAFHEATDAPSTLAVFEQPDHLAWLDPTNPAFEDAFELVRSFLDRELKGASVDLADAAGSATLSGGDANNG